MTHIAPPVCGCVVTPIITLVALCVIIFFGCCTYIVNPSLKIDRGAFSTLKIQSSDFSLKSGVTVVPKSQGNTISWNKVSDASYYEIYQKMSGGEYTLLKKTKSISHTFRSLKPGKEYTFAVKPVAVIPAANYDKEKDEGEYPESFTIEGTMSEDIVVIGK